MLKINYGYWQNACAKDSMVKAHQLRRQLKITLKEALRLAWREIKQFFNSISKTYKEYKYKLKINNKTIVITAKNKVNPDKLIEACLTKIAEVKGKQFMYNVSNRLYKAYDESVNHLDSKGSLTFAQDVYIVRMKQEV